MRHIRKVLVPIDFSECSRAALEQAIWIARRTGAELGLLHVWQAGAFLAEAEREPSRPSLAFSEAAHHKEQRELARIVEEVFARGVAVTSAWRDEGVPSRVIVEEARKADVDLLVMGTHGLSGLEHALVGSVVERVLRRAPCPVLSVRAGLPGGFPREVRRILAPVDLSKGSRLALEAALGLSSLLGAEADAVHVWDRPAWVSDSIKVQTPSGPRPLRELVHDNEERQLQEFLASLPGGAGKVSRRLISGEPASAILAELDRAGYDLCVVATHGRSGLRHLLLGSVTERLVRLAKVPVLTVPPRAIHE